MHFAQKKSKQIKDEYANARTKFTNGEQLKLNTAARNDSGFLKEKCGLSGCLEEEQ